jgi:hypothetical protein
MALVLGSSARAVFVDLRGLNSPATSTSAGGIALDWSTTLSGSFVSTPTSFGFNATGAGDSTQLIDGGAGLAEEIGFVFRTPVYLDSVVLSQFGGADGGTFTVQGSGMPPYPLANGVNDLGGVIAASGAAHVLRWTGANVPGGGLGFSVDGFNVRPVAPFSADFNFDSAVDGADFLIWQRGVGLQAPPVASPAQGNANFDAGVNGLDLQVWRMQFSSTEVSIVPELGGCALLGIGILAVLVQRTWSLQHKRRRNSTLNA